MGLKNAIDDQCQPIYRHDRFIRTVLIKRVAAILLDQLIIIFVPLFLVILIGASDMVLNYALVAILFAPTAAISTLRTFYLNISLVKRSSPALDLPSKSWHHTPGHTCPGGQCQGVCAQAQVSDPPHLTAGFRKAIARTIRSNPKSCATRPQTAETRGSRCTVPVGRKGRRRRQMGAP